MSKPEIGQWYQHLDKGELFLVTGVDEESGTIEIQYFGGDLDEIDFESWDQLELAPAEAPEDWTGPMDDVETDDLGYSDAESQPPNWIQSPEPLRVEPRGETRDGVPSEIGEIAGEEE